MRRRGIRTGLAIARLAPAFLALGCGSKSTTPGFSDFTGTDASSGDADVLSDGGPSFVDAPSFTDGGAPEDTAVYGQSYDTLYAMNPKTKAVTVIGKFSGCSYVVDIAFDKDMNMFATTLDGLYTVDRTTAQCSKVASGTYPNSLSFVPVGTLDPNVEALVGFFQDAYVRIDTKTGAITNVGKIGQGYASSGDIVAVKGGGAYLTVKGGPDGSCNDCLVEIDPATGAFLRSWGPLGKTDVFGIAFWGGAVYGFDQGGDLFEVDFAGVASQVTKIPVPNAPPGLSFQGAATTTLAPLTPVK
jgi:hypothetical protein